MPRAPRIQFPGAYHHITSRGNAKQQIFHDDNDRTYFLRTLAHVVRELDWHCNAYCLMDNHFHFLLETPEPNLSAGMKYLNGVYSQRFNVRYGRIGHLMQGRFFSRLVTGDSYYLALARYILLNPVRAGFCATAREWRLSSYRATAGHESIPDFLDVSFLLDMFSDEPVSPGMGFASFVACTESLEPDTARSKMKSLLDEMNSGQRPALEDLFSGELDRNQRNSRIVDAYLNHGYAMKVIAEHLGLHESSICRVLKNHRDREDVILGV